MNDNKNAMYQAQWYARQKNTGIVYKLCIDGLTYIGGTTNSLKKRLWQHRAGNFAATRPFIGDTMARAVIIELEAVSDPELLKERVKFWIAKEQPELLPQTRGGYRRKLD